MFSGLFFGCNPDKERDGDSNLPEPLPVIPQKVETLVMAGGCFWCVEGVYSQLTGVIDVESGYIGGSANTANYQAVCSGKTNHAEAVRVSYDANVLPLKQLLTVFFVIAHDPTQKDRQGADVGHQYRSALFYRSEAHKLELEKIANELWNTGIIDGRGARLETTYEPAGEFYIAEKEHQDYVQRYLSGEPIGNASYVQCAALPKIEKLREAFPGWVR